MPRIGDSLPPTNPGIKRDLQSPGPQLKRNDSLPARLPSDPTRRTEIEHTRPPITRPERDAVPPKTFGIPEDKDVAKAGRLKAQAQEKYAQLDSKMKFGVYKHFEKKIHSDPEFKEIKDRAEVKFRASVGEKTEEVFQKMVLTDLMAHPRFRAEFAKARNEKQGLPNAPTSFRTMTEREHVFLMNAHNRISEFVHEHPHRAFGEMGLAGNKNGEIRLGTDGKPHVDYAAGKCVHITGMKDKAYNLHTHPPFAEPFTSSASAPDHKAAAHYYQKQKMFSYVSNGKDVILVNPHDMGIQKLVPNPEVEEKLGKFPTAFTMPDPEPPPYPFTNHEAAT
jgi:hypothetical protein